MALFKIAIYFQLKISSKLNQPHQRWAFDILPNNRYRFNESRSLCTSAFSFERLNVKISAPRKLASIQGKVWFTLFSVTMVKFSFNFSPPALFKSWHWLRDVMLCWVKSLKLLFKIRQWLSPSYNWLDIVSKWVLKLANQISILDW